jgi:diguanylate cyclase (GGDEF)-like protein
MDVPVRFIDSIINNPLLMQFLVHRWFFLLEYDPRLDQLRVYDTRSRTLETLDAYLGSEKPEHATIFAEDRWKMRALLTGELFGPLEMRFVSPEGVYYSREVDARPVEDPARGTLYVGYAKDITDQKNQTQELLEQARHDSLTQLYNNRTGKELIDRYLQAKDPYASCGMLVIDLDFFKNVNDRYGHLFGDKVLQEFARMLRTLFRSSDILVRFGGDEFVVFLKDIPNTTLLQKTRQLSESVQQVKFWKNDYRMTCSIGACFLPENTAGYSFDQLFENADWALYQAKQNGRNQYVFCDNLRRYAQAVPAAPETADIDARYLHNDLISTAFELFELTRWIKPDGTVVYPDQFIPILESTGRIVDLDLYIFEQVAQFLQRNAQAGHRLLPIAVNASAVLAREDAPTQEYSEILEKHNISARMLEIELTETAVVSEYDRVKRLLSSFQSDGMQTSLDDFGAGGSLLNNMVDIPVNTIKLDKLFLTRCSSNARDTDFLREVVHLVKRLGYNVICEGIETEEQVQLLRSLDCDGAQGFWFSKAIPAEEFERRYLCD